MKQHTSPCAGCPFNRKVTPAELGGSPPETYVGQVQGPFFLPCHSHHDYKRDETRRNPDNAQCAGAAIFRANIGRDVVMPDALLHLPADTETVFASFAEFMAHHHSITVGQAELLLKLATPDERMKWEFRRAGVKNVPMTRKDSP